MRNLNRRSFLGLLGGSAVAALVAPVGQRVAAAPIFIPSERLDRVPRLMVPTLRPPDLGLYGDGIHDDTVAIQAMLDRGDAVRLPSGIYKVTGALEMRRSGIY